MVYLVMYEFEQFMVYIDYGSNVSLWHFMFGDLRFDVIVYSVHISDWSHDDIVISVWFGYVWWLVGSTGCAMF